MTDTSTPIGAIDEVKGSVTIVRADGSSESATIGTPVFQGDVVQTSESGSASITFVDDTNFALSNNAHFSIDDYSFNAANESGNSDFSVLRGVFVFTSGLIGRDDPDDVTIDTPVGSIGIRGTIIAGNINPDGQSDITVIEGAIVVSNGVSNVTLAQQYESVSLGSFDAPIQPQGILQPQQVAEKYNVVSDVAPRLFSTIDDTAQDQQNGQNDLSESEGDEPVQENQSENSPAENNGNQPAEQETDQKNNEETQLDAEDGLKQQSDGKSLFDKILNNQDGARDGSDNMKMMAKSMAADKSNNANRIQGKIHSDRDDSYNPAAHDRTQSNTDKPDTTPGNNAGGNGGSSGGSSGGGTPPAGGLDLNDATAVGVNIISDNVGNQIGANISAYGDLNGDGFADFVFQNLNSSQAHDYVIYGKGGEFGDVSIPARVDTNIDSIDDSDADAGDIGVLNAGYAGVAPAENVDIDGDGLLNDLVSIANNEVTLNLSGGSITIENSLFQTVLNGNHINIGDVNGDGYSDIMVDTVKNGGIGYDGAFILYGGQQHSDLALIHSNNGSLGFEIELPSTHRLLSHAGGAPAISSAGDFNGDGYDDVMIGVTDGTNGHIYVVYGGESGSLLNMDLSDLNDATKAFHMSFDLQAGGEIHMAGVGDTNGDGFDDIAIGMTGATGDDGKVVLVNGRDDQDIVKTVTAGTPYSAQSHGESIVGTSSEDVIHVGHKQDIRINAGNGDDLIKLNDGSFGKINGGGGFDTLQLTKDGGSIDFSDMGYESMQQIEKIEFGNSDQTITLTVENLFNLLQTANDNTLYISNLDGMTGNELKIGTDPHNDSIASQIADFLSNLVGFGNVSSLGPFNKVGHGNTEFDKYVTNINGEAHTLYIDSSIAVETGNA